MSAWIALRTQVGHFPTTEKCQYRNCASLRRAPDRARGHTRIIVHIDNCRSLRSQRVAGNSCVGMGGSHRMAGDSCSGMARRSLRARNSSSTAAARSSWNSTESYSRNMSHSRIRSLQPLRLHKPRGGMSCGRPFDLSQLVAVLLGH
jgi:hypothetical protein